MVEQVIKNTVLVLGRGSRLVRMAGKFQCYFYIIQLGTAIKFWCPTELQFTLGMDASSKTSVNLIPIQAQAGPPHTKCFMVFCLLLLPSYNKICVGRLTKYQMNFAS